MTNNINGNGARYHLELLMAKNFVKKLTMLLETNSSINIFVSSARNMPKFQVITEGSQQWYECYLHYIPTMIDEMTSNKLSRNDAINILISIEDISPKSIGAFLALFEHKVAFLGLLLKINSFDQPSVEYGKMLSKQILERKNNHKIFL